MPEAGSPAARMASQRGEPLPGADYLGGGRVLGINPVRTLQVATIPVDAGQRRGSGVGIATGGSKRLVPLGAFGSLQDCLSAETSS